MKITKKDYIWHWFLVTGYEENKEDFKVQIATYGQKIIFSLADMWDTGYEEKGEFIEYL